MLKVVFEIEDFNWGRSERVSDRYGAFLITLEHQAKLKESGLLGSNCKVSAKVLEVRKSEHIGDLFHGFSPITPDLGEVVELGIGKVSIEETSDQLLVNPADKRDCFYLDPWALYHVHSQRVEITVEQTEQIATPLDEMWFMKAGSKSEKPAYFAQALAEQKK